MSDENLNRRESDRLTEQEKAFDSLTPEEMAFFRKLFLANRAVKMVMLPLLSFFVALISLNDQIQNFVKGLHL